MHFFMLNQMYCFMIFMTRLRSQYHETLHLAYLSKSASDAFVYSTRDVSFNSTTELFVAASTPDLKM